MNNLGIIIQARLGSTRLPMKMVKSFFNKKGIFELITEKIKIDFPDVKVIVATSNNPIDDQLETICKKIGISCFRGSENNVLDRFIKAAEHHEISKIIRICADNPFLNIKSLRNLVNLSTHSEADYSSFQTSKYKPTITTHFGFWAELVALSALKRVQKLTNEGFYEEHVTNFIYNNPNLFIIDMITISEEIEKNENIRMTLDTMDDFLLLQEIYLENPNFQGSPEELIAVVSKNKKWLNKMEIQISKNQK